MELTNFHYKASKAGQCPRSLILVNSTHPCKFLTRIIPDQYLRDLTEPMHKNTGLLLSPRGNFESPVDLNMLFFGLWENATHSDMGRTCKLHRERLLFHSGYELGTFLLWDDSATNLSLLHPYVFVNTEYTTKTQCGLTAKSPKVVSLPKHEFWNNVFTFLLLVIHR